MQAQRSLPESGRLSILMATILLVYALGQYVKIPAQVVSFTVLGVVFDFRINFATWVGLIAAGLAAVGMDWLLRGHPHLTTRQTWQHWGIPALTAWALEVTLNTLQIGTRWWAVFALGAVLLALVFTAEYIIIDTSNPLHAPATISLTAVSFALYLILAISAHASSMRLYVLLPVLVFPLAVVVLRSLHLRLGGKWRLAWAAGISLAVGQLGMALHYLPLTPQVFGMALLAPGYALTSLAGAIEEERPARTRWIEPAVMFVVLLAVTFLLSG